MRRVVAVPIQVREPKIIITPPNRRRIGAAVLVCPSYSTGRKLVLFYGFHIRPVAGRDHSDSDLSLRRISPRSEHGNL